MPFSLTSLGEDNAESLISLYEVEPEEVPENVYRMMDWLDGGRAGKRAEPWLTEGYDDAVTPIEGKF